MRTTVRLGVVRTDALRIEGPDGLGSAAVTVAKPAGIGLRNDGVHAGDWLHPGKPVLTLAHDGTGWVVPELSVEHTLRLWDLRGARFASVLPLVGAVSVALEPELTYELRLVDGEWSLHLL